MSCMAQWLSKSWEVSAKKIVKLESLTTGLALEAEKNDDANGTPSADIRGYQTRSLTLSTKYGIAAGTPDVRAEYESWEALVGANAPFYIGGRRIGAPKYLLSSVKPSDIILDNSGRWLEATISFTFEEYAPEAAGSKGAVKGSSTSKSKTVTPTMATAKSASAVNVGAKMDDKAARKVATL